MLTGDVKRPLLDALKRAGVKLDRMHSKWTTHLTAIRPKTTLAIRPGETYAQVQPLFDEANKCIQKLAAAGAPTSEINLFDLLDFHILCPLDNKTKRRELSRTLALGSDFITNIVFVLVKKQEDRVTASLNELRETQEELLEWETGYKMGEWRSIVEQGESGWLGGEWYFWAKGEVEGHERQVRDFCEALRVMERMWGRQRLITEFF